METAEDLYNKPYFRPYLNRMYYQEVQWNKSHFYNNLPIK